MTGWLPRSLVTMAVGGILAFGVTVQVAHVDIQAAGAVIFFAGLLYLLVHLGLYGWERGWGAPRSQPDSPASPAYDAEPSPRLRPRGDRPPPAPAPHPYPDRGTGRARTGRPYANRAPYPDAERTRVMPALDPALDTDATDATAPIRRRDRPDPHG